MQLPYSSMLAPNCRIQGRACRGNSRPLAPSPEVLRSSRDHIGRTNSQVHFATNSTMYPCGRSPSSHPIAPPWVPLRGPPVGTPFGGKPRRRRVPALELTPHELFNSACLSSSQSTACPSTSHCSAYTPSFLLCNYNYNYN